jgi:hypothetical protein
MSNPEPELVRALPEGAWVLQESIFLVPTSPWPGSDQERAVHGEVQQIITLIYAMLACGMDMYTIKTRLLGIDE